MKQQLIRQLGNLETTMALLHSELNGTTQVTTVINIKGNIKFQYMYEASKILFNTFYLLKTCISYHSEKLYFFMHDDFSQIKINSINNHNNYSMEQILTQEMRNILDASISLWRLNLYSNDDDNDESNIAITLHHAISDGYTKHLIIKYLLDTIYKLINKQNTDYIINNTFAHSLDFYLPNTIPHNCDPEFNNLNLQFTHAQTCNIEKRGTNVYLQYIEPHLFKKITHYCANKSIKINAFIATIFYTEFCTVTTNSEILFYNAISYRNKLNHTKFISDFGCFADVVGFTLQTNNKNIHELAIEYQNKLSMHIQNSIIATNNYEYKMLKKLIQQIGHDNYFTGIGMTNTGDIGIANNTYEPHFTVLNYLSSASRVGGNLATILHVSYFNDRVNLLFAYPTPLIKHETIQNIATKMINHIKAL